MVPVLWRRLSHLERPKSAIIRLPQLDNRTFLSFMSRYITPTLWIAWRPAKNRIEDFQHFDLKIFKSQTEELLGLVAGKKMKLLYIQNCIVGCKLISWSHLHQKIPMKGIPIYWNSQRIPKDQMALDLRIIQEFFKYLQPIS